MYMVYAVVSTKGTVFQYKEQENYSILQNTAWKECLLHKHKPLHVQKGIDRTNKNMFLGKCQYK